MARAIEPSTPPPAVRAPRLSLSIEHKPGTAAADAALAAVGDDHRLGPLCAGSYRVSPCVGRR